MELEDKIKELSGLKCFACHEQHQEYRLLEIPDRMRTQFPNTYVTCPEGATMQRDVLLEYNKQEREHETRYDM